MSKSFKSKVKNNIKDESSANKMYKSMAKKAPTKTDKKMLQEMARDEADHKKKLINIKKRMNKRK